MDFRFLGFVLRQHELLLHVRDVFDKLLVLSDHIRCVFCY